MGQGRRQDIEIDQRNLTTPATPDAQRMDGSYAGFQPKPAVEVVLVAMKPLSENTYVDQALANGKGVTWLDACRVPFNGKDWGWEKKTIRDKKTTISSDFRLRDIVQVPHPAGRFPANLLCSDDALNDGIERQSGGTSIESNRTLKRHLRGNSMNGEINLSNIPPDSGSYSRYFDLDAWFAERLAALPESARRTFPWLIVPKPSRRERTCGGAVDNRHPTVKPVKLFAYLLTLGSRPGETVLDPFGGSGTTGIACKLLHREGILFEQDEDSLSTLQRRIAQAHACAFAVNDLTQPTTLL